MGTRHGDLDQRIRHRPAKATQLILVDEAGPCGAWLSRSLGNQGDAGWVDVPRVDTPRPLMRDVGRIPSDDARGERRRQGAMSQTGHPPARRARVEGAWAAIPRPSVATGHGAWRHAPTPHRIAAGRRQYAAAPATDSGVPGGHTPSTPGWPSHANGVP
jgi:hypothetical protein